MGATFTLALTVLRRWVLPICAIGLMSIVLKTAWLQAQASAQVADQPRFDVTSVKPNNTNDGQISVTYRNGRYTGIGVSVSVLLRSAYQVQEFQIVGAPGWLESERYDVLGVAEPDPVVASSTLDPGPSRQQQLLRALLADRFNLAVHTETRELPIYAIVLARSDRRLGPQLRPSTTDCATARDAAACGTGVAPGFVRVRGGTMASLATALSRLTNTGSSLNRLVVDRSGLEGTFDVEMRFTPDNIPGSAAGNPAFGIPPIDRDGASIFTAMQEQLRLRLDPQRGPVEVLVIDRVERPTPD